ncbi:DUF551 domain-containing protein [Klebsiella michiganensis]|uniref:DUF551 domain-containing protein n=1 Tax=Klebsiella michiganensis TaxID=1134687 RepID=UPI00255A9277|nr:DUF551 domain-containing protein [Klebsiella michiganensis]MDL4446689.1 DUF551 domain-containing protein [Klebsiella michiganensis]MDL4490515.1 DUF551 domain-containing protein [Klebsiella michiganensis]MDL4659258.1 DUF551 domain-containing protein [Klebsiella michiganensis]
MSNFNGFTGDNDPVYYSRKTENTDGTLTGEGTKQAGNPPVITGAEQRIADAVELLQKAAPAMLADNSGPDGPLAGRLKSPVIPDGYVMVPKEATEKMLIAGLEEANPLGGLIDWDASRGDCNTRAQVQGIFKAMLAAATQPQNAPQNIPEIIPGWIPVSERMPDDAKWCVVNTDYGYYVQCWSKGQGWLGDDISIPNCDVTHWMPIAAAPQEVKGES